jgi:hypothetical protein
MPLLSIISVKIPKLGPGVTGGENINNNEIWVIAKIVILLFMIGTVLLSCDNMVLEWAPIKCRLNESV